MKTVWPSSEISNAKCEKHKLLPPEPVYAHSRRTELAELRGQIGFEDAVEQTAVEEVDISASEFASALPLGKPPGEFG